MLVKCMKRKPSNYYKGNPELCLELAKKCKTRTEFHTKYPSAYRVLSNLGRLDEAHKPTRNPPVGWTKELCISTAKAYTNRADLKKDFGGIFAAARKFDVWDECFSHIDDSNFTYSEHQGVIKVQHKGKTALIDKEYFHLIDNKKINFSPITDRNKTQYVRLRAKKSDYNVPLHRLILGLKRGDKIQVDHINGNGLDNRKCNLRIVTSTQNVQNKPPISTWGKGVRKRVYKNGTVKYRARIRFNNILYYLGQFNTAEEARKAYDEKAKEFFGENCFLNYPSGS